MMGVSKMRIPGKSPRFFKMHIHYLVQKKVFLEMPRIAAWSRRKSEVWAQPGPKEAGEADKFNWDFALMS